MLKKNFPQICLCLAASAHGFFGKLLATKKELTKSCRTGEITTYSTEYSTQCDDAVRWNKIRMKGMTPTIC